MLKTIAALIFMLSFLFESSGATYALRPMAESNQEINLLSDEFNSQLLAKASSSGDSREEIVEKIRAAVIELVDKRKQNSKSNIAHLSGHEKASLLMERVNYYGIDIDKIICDTNVAILEQETRQAIEELLEIGTEFTKTDIAHRLDYAKMSGLINRAKRYNVDLGVLDVSIDKANAQIFTLKVKKAVKELIDEGESPGKTNLAHKLDYSAARPLTNAANVYRVDIDSIINETSKALYTKKIRNAIKKLIGEDNLVTKIDIAYSLNCRSIRALMRLVDYYVIDLDVLIDEAANLFYTQRINDIIEILLAKYKEPTGFNIGQEFGYTKTSTLIRRAKYYKVDLEALGVILKERLSDDDFLQGIKGAINKLVGRHMPVTPINIADIMGFSRSGFLRRVKLNNIDLILLGVSLKIALTDNEFLQGIESAVKKLQDMGITPSPENVATEVGYSHARSLDKRARSLNVDLREIIKQFIDEYYLNMIDDLGLSEAIALFGKEDPLRLYQYIKIYHPELSEELVQAIVAIARGMLKGLRSYDSDYDTGPTMDEIRMGYKVSLDEPILDDLPKATGENYFVLNGKVEDDSVTRLRLLGSCKRTILVRKNKTFSVAIPLADTGEAHSFELYAYSDQMEIRSAIAYFDIEQTGDKVDAEEVFRKLLVFKEDILGRIKGSPEHYQYLVECIELSLLKMFTYGEEQGIEDLRNLIKEEQANEKKHLYKIILDKFIKIKNMKVDNLKPDQRLYFFQKYAIYRMLELKDAGEQGVILAAEQGLGKTLMSLVLMNGFPALVIAPSPVVSTWTEAEDKFFHDKNLDSLEGSHKKRDVTLKNSESRQFATNKEFTRNMPKERRVMLIRQGEELLIIDEADYLNSANSQESVGTRRLRSAFKVLVTATPFKQPKQIVRLLRFLYPDDPKFKSDKAFAKAFNSDRESLDALYLLLRKHMIRIRKQDVFDMYDRGIPLEDQNDRLPERIEVFPGTEGIELEQDARFYLTREQCDSILELFTDYYTWCEKHVLNGEITDEDKANLKKVKKENRFSKMHALRQIMNNTKCYFGISGIKSPKHRKMDNIVGYELNKTLGRKVLIFCQYKDQVREYQKRYTEYGTRVFYGDIECNSNGYKIDKRRKLLFYIWDKKEKKFLLDDNGYPILTDKSGKDLLEDNLEPRQMRALDYERIVFQNSPTDRVMIATFAQGALGVTLTAADAVIFDDIAKTYRDEYQAAERAHRIDNKRKKYDVTYYWMQALYPEDFLESVKGKTFTYEKHSTNDEGDIVTTKVTVDIYDFFFKEGTYDQVLFDVLRNQGAIFHEITDGIGDFSELALIKDKIFKSKMPYMFWENLNENNQENGEGSNLAESDSDNMKESSAGTLLINPHQKYLNEQQLLTAA